MKRIIKLTSTNILALILMAIMITKEVPFIWQQIITLYVVVIFIMDLVFLLDFENYKDYCSICHEEKELDKREYICNDCKDEIL